jgi:hypothetical protein
MNSRLAAIRSDGEFACSHQVVVLTFMNSCFWVERGEERDQASTCGLPSYLTTLRVARTRRTYHPPTAANSRTTPQHIQTMALLVDKHRPRSLEALSYHPELSDRLRALVRNPSTASIEYSN